MKRSLFSILKRSKSSEQMLMQRKLQRGNVGAKMLL